MIEQETEEAEALAPTVARAGAACSFDGTTPVLMADGTTKAIGRVQAGDFVKSGDPSTSSTHTELVAQLHLNLDTDLADVTVADSNGHQSVIHTTQNHPFWDQTQQAWLPVDHLTPGDKLHTTEGSATVQSIRPTTGTRLMYNLTISATHRYYVLAGNTPVLVHNTPCDVDTEVRIGIPTLAILIRAPTSALSRVERRAG